MWYLWMIIGGILTIFAMGILAGGKVSDYEAKIYQLKKDNLALSYRLTKYENAVGRV